MLHFGVHVIASTFETQVLISNAGFPITFGVFQDYYSRQPEFENNSNISAIGAVATSIFFLGAPIASPLVRKYQRWQRHLVVGGTTICAVSLLAASFATSVPGLIATQGVMYGLGFAMQYFPVLRMLDEWFVRRRGLAYGLLFAGGALSGTVLPFLLEMLLSKYGYRTTLKGVAVAQFILIAPVLPLIKGRLPTSKNNMLRAVNWGFFKQPLFWCFAFSNLAQGLGYFIPALFLSSFASNMGLSGTMSALVLATYNIATVIGQVSFGYVSDRTDNVLILVFASSFVSSIAAFCLWGFANSLGGLLAFSLVYGWSAGGFVVLWQKFGSTLSYDTQTIVSLMAFGKGIGNITTAPITGALITQPVSSEYGLGKFQAVILFLGASMLCSSLAIFGWPLKRHN